MSLLSGNDYFMFHQRQAGYQISDQDENSGDSDIIYYGFVNQQGEWYIMEEDTSVDAGGLQEWRFIKGDSDYATNWAARQALSYDTFQATFG